MTSDSFDLCVIAGGVNGAGIARDAAGRGLKVLLVEAGDLAGATSSASTKLIHGGLRYLEHGAIRLVREALREREVLLQLAPHIVRPLRFVLPAYPGPRSAVLLRIGLFLYDHLGGGYARYSTDAEWLVPHFEKMLYDNAELIQLLTLVWRDTGAPLYAQRVAETVEWLMRDMTAEADGFAASFDAGDKITVSWTDNTGDKGSIETAVIA